MTYDDIIMLAKIEPKIDELGVESGSIVTSTPVYCNKKSASSSAFYAAGQEGNRPAYVFTIHRFEYDGQEQVEFDGKRYKVERTYEVGVEELELHVSEVVGIEN